jgi:polysaccharide biosynthesis/export protein
MRTLRRWLSALVLGVMICTLAVGCQSVKYSKRFYGPEKCPLDPKIPPPPDVMPRELQKTALPDYIIEPPDVLLINAVKIVPKPPFKIGTLDVLVLKVDDTLPDSPIEEGYTVEPGGTINLGSPYGSVKVVDMTIDEAQAAVAEHLKKYLREPVVAISLGATAGSQQIAGEHIVGPDGKISLGTYGKVFVTGMTQEQARATIEAHLAQFLDRPEVAVDIYAYNSKVYYVVTQGAGLGDGVARFPVTGNETVLDAIAQINGLESVSSKRIWIARPAPHGAACDQVLPVDWHAITERAETTTNYQLMPGDRLFVAEDKLVAMDTFISKVTAPVERLFGFTLLGTQTVSSLRFFKQRGSNSGFNNQP